jgi:NAD(P)-dependent dehydrogenase (short-subunit alcohol dehydrogenase family)
MNVFAGVRSDDAAESIRAEKTSRLIPVEVDVAIPDSVRNAMDWVGHQTKSEGLHGLVNNAGIALGGPIETTSLDDWQRQFAVNLFGATSVTKAAIPLLRAAQGARIVNIGSILGLVAAPFLAPYSASKHALESLTACLRIELAPWKIFASVIQAGNVQTPIWDKAQKESDDLTSKLSPMHTQMYGKRIESMSEIGISAGRRGVSPHNVARVIEHALTSRHPRRSYRVGIDAKAFAAAKRLLPANVFEYFLIRRFRLHASDSEQERTVCPSDHSQIKYVS